MSTASVWDLISVEDDGIRIELYAQQSVNLALVHNRVPLIQRLTVTNIAERGAVDVTATVELQSAGELLAPAWSQTHDGNLDAGDEVTWSNLSSVVPSDQHLRMLNESHPANLIVTVTRLWGADVRLVVPIQVLAHNEWFNAPMFYDSLAAFVQPNTRGVQTVLNDAAELLRRQSGDASLVGYQSGPERAAYTAAAIYEALRGRSIRYITPPASFEDSGQKIRTTSQVLDDRFGTCIDLSVTYAACLEAAGLRPLIWLVEGHAFAGFMREDTTLAHTTITETNAMVNLVESNKAIPVEAFYYKCDFAEAVAAGRNHVLDPDSLRAVVEISAVRRNGVRPLPTVDEVQPDTSPSESDYSTPTTTSLTIPALLKSPGADDAVVDSNDAAPLRVRKWKRALLDLSTRNRLLNLRESAQVIDLLVPAQGLAELDDLIHAEKPITLCPSDDLSALQTLQGARTARDVEDGPLLQYLSKDHTAFAAVSDERYATRFKNLQRSARTLLEETGSANLYLTFGALIHQTSTGRPARAPLFLLPVKLVGGTGRSRFQILIDSSVVASANHCLVQWLRIKHGVSIPALESPPKDESGIDIDGALQSIRTGLVDNNLDFRIDELATLSICQFSTFGMWQDLDRNWEVLARSPLVDHLTHRAGESFVDPHNPEGTDLQELPVDESAIAVPIGADGSQLRAVTLAAGGHTFVLEGPPGTGKSQTITNLIAHTLDQGKTVLFVAEKQAALDVVKKRLGKVGLSKFTLDLHGKNQTPAAIRSQLKSAIDNAADYNDYAWQSKVAEFRARHAPLAAYPGKIHSRNSTGLSLWDATAALADGDNGRPTAPITAAHVSSPRVDANQIADALRHFARAASGLELRPDSPWTIVKRIGTDDYDRLVPACLALDQALLSVRQDTVAAAILQSLPSPAQIPIVLEQTRRQSGWIRLDDPSLARLQSADWRAGLQQLKTEIETLQSRCKLLYESFNSEFIRQGDPRLLDAQALDVSKGLFGRKKREDQFARNLAPALLPGVSLTPDEAIPLLRSIPGARAEAIAAIRHMSTLFGPLAPSGWDPLDTRAIAQLDPVLDYISQTTEFTQKHPAEWRVIMQAPAIASSSDDTLQRVHRAWHDWNTILGSSPAELHRWARGAHWLDAWQRDHSAWLSDAHDADLDSARRWSVASKFLDPLRDANMDEFIDQLLSGHIPASEGEIAFLRGQARASINERRRVSGLSVFDTQLRLGEISDYVATSQSLRAEQCAALPAALLSRRPFQSGGLKGAVGRLRRQLDAKSGGMSFRSMMNEFADEIVQATPCFFVSPASLAQFVPPDSVTFDLVVFDEASQITVAQAIGALGRGRSAVVVGDSQQMPPTSIGQASLGDDDSDDDDVVPEDLESILTECVESGIPRIWLSWHYRSQDESLITFSNHHYYEGRLASLPAPGGNPDVGIEWNRVDGHFNREDKKTDYRTNRVEAEAIVAEVLARVTDPSRREQSIGIVTFNQPQQDLILTMLEATGEHRVSELLRPETDDGIFVKNLENVQGDERDVILFSTAFSKKPGDDKLPLNFGPLTRGGGERRLNVAITRARRKVVIYSSFDPSDIELSRTRSTGMAHLRAYLEMAQSSGQQSTKIGTNHLTDHDANHDALCAALRDRGYVAEKNYGLSEFVVDIAVRRPDASKWQVAVMTDGPQWARRRTVADRDLTPGLLESMMQWGAVIRFWLPEWIDNPESVLSRIDNAVTASETREAELQQQMAAARAAQAALIAEEQARQSDIDSVTSVAVEDIPVAVIHEDAGLPKPAALIAHQMVDLDSVPAEQPAGTVGPRDWHGLGTSYVEAPAGLLGVREDLDRTYSATIRGLISQAVRDTIAAEGPIAVERLARTVVRRFGFNRAAAKRQDVVRQQIPQELIRQGELGDFVWPREIDPLTWNGYRKTPEGIDRPLDEIAPEEIINAMKHVCQRSVDDRELLMRRTLTHFNQKRLTSQSEERLDHCIEYGVSTGKLLRIGRGYAAGI